MRTEEEMRLDPHVPYGARRDYPPITAFRGATALPLSGMPRASRPPPAPRARPIVLVESPYRGHPDALRYLACCLLDSILRGECPIASHAHIPLALPEDVESYAGETGRDIGLACRDALAAKFFAVRYTDLGITPGMRRVGDYLVDRQLRGVAREVWSRGEWPSPARITANHEQGTK